jgi:hypothetical protein
MDIQKNKTQEDCGPQANYKMKGCKEGFVLLEDKKGILSQVKLKELVKNYKG